MARETSAKMLDFVAAMAREAGLDMDAAVEGLALAEVDWSRFGARVDWDEFAIVAERLCGHLSDDELRELGRTYFRVHPWVAMVAQLSGLTPRILADLAMRVSRPAHRHWSWDFDFFASPGVLALEIPDGYRGSRPIMMVLVGELEVLPEIVLGEPVEIDAQVSSHRFEASIHYRSALKARERAYRAGQRLTASPLREAKHLMFNWLAADDARTGVPSVVELQRSLELTRAEARVAHRLARGLTVSDCAADLGVSRNTVRTHLARIYSKTGQRSQAALVSHLLRH